MWKQLREDTTKIVKKDLLAHLFDTSNVGYEEVKIFLIKQMITNITTQKFGLGYTTVYGTSHHGVMPFLVPSLDLTTMDQLDISQQTEYGVGPP